MKLVRINESSQELNELFGKKAKKSKNLSKNSSKQSNVEREVFNNNNVKKWLKQAKFTGKDLEAGFQGINSTAKVTLDNNKTVGVALYRISAARLWQWLYLATATPSPVYGSNQIDSVASLDGARFSIASSTARI